VANAVAVDTWEGRGVHVGDVVNALGELRHQSDRSSTRTAVMTLVVVTTNDDQQYAAIGALRALGGRHPARIILLRPDPDQVAALDARATLFAAESDDHCVNFEEISLFVGGQAAYHLDSVVEAFTLADLPVVGWYVGAVADPADSLLPAVDSVLLDSRDVTDPRQLAHLLQLAGRRTVVDLSWIRLEPWRDLLAGLFDPPAYRPFVRGVTTAEVKGKAGPRRLLGGWLSAQLGLSALALRLIDAQHVEIRLEAHWEGEVGTFDVGRAEHRRSGSGPCPGRWP
jgi:glucose-6-phosphate dehydrogenase assembly protein OpcA